MKIAITQFLKNVPGWLTVHEGLFLEKAVVTLSRKNGEIVEIGSFMGKSTIWLAMTGERVYAVDPHKGIFSGGKTKPTLPLFLKNISYAGVGKNVKPIVKTSNDAAKTWKKPIKFLFIDGLHDKKHAYDDVMSWSPFIVSGGMIAMHDAFCGWQGAGEAAMEHIVRNSRFGEVGVIGSIIWGLAGKPTFAGRIKRLFTVVVIELCQRIHRTESMPGNLKFIIIHRFLRIFLINRYTSFL